MQTQTCSKCGETLPLSSYYRNNNNKSGWYTYCKSCVKAQTDKWRTDNSEKYKSTCAAKAKRHRESGQSAKYSAEYKKRNRAKITAKQRAWRRANMEKDRAHNAVQRAVASGALVRPCECSACGSRTRIEAHHTDYSKPLGVVWLCRRCHVIADKERQQEEHCHV